MKGIDVTEIQMAAAEKFILLHRRGDQDRPHRDQRVSMVWEDMLRLVALYGAIRCEMGLKGVGPDEPGEVYKTSNRCDGRDS